MKFQIKQKVPAGTACTVRASNTRQAIEIVSAMIELGATEIEIKDDRGNDYDLIDLEQMAVEEEDQPGDKFFHRESLEEQHAWTTKRRLLYWE